MLRNPLSYGAIVLAVIFSTGCKRHKSSAPLPPPATVQALPNQAPPVDAETLTASPAQVVRMTEAYFGRFGYAPRNWDELVKAGYLKSPPTGSDGKPVDMNDFIRRASK